MIEDNIALRPLLLNDFFGQNKIKEQINVALSGAKQRNEVMGHSLFFGPPGLGKTTLAKIVSNEMGGNFKSITAPSLQKAGDLVSILLNLNQGDVFFIDEIHRIPKDLEELLYVAMEDFKVDIATDGKQDVISLALQPFTLIGATTKRGMLSKPLIDRFDNSYQLIPYSEEEIIHIVNRSAHLMDMTINNDACILIAERSRNTPRIANKLLKLVRNYMAHNNMTIADKKIAKETFDLYSIHRNGLDDRDITYLTCLKNRFNGGPVGLSTLATALGEDEKTVISDIEPYLVQEGYIDRSNRGRILVKYDF